MLTAHVGGQRLMALGGHGPITVEYGPHGSEAASWQMNETVRHPALRGNKLVEIYDGGFCIWTGTLVEPEGSTYTARGIWHQAANLYPMDYLGNLTTNIDAALYGAIITRGELPGWTQPVSISNVDWSDTEPSDSMKLSELFDRYAAEHALNWYVNPQRQIIFEVAPTVPQWVVPHAVAGRGLVPADDEFFTHLAGRYLDAGGAYQTTIVGSTEAETVFGRRTALVDLSDLGNTDATRANSVLTGMLLKSGARMGYGEGLELGFGQITTPGNTPAPLNQIQSLQMVRLAGTVDTSRPNLMRGNTDGVLETVKYTDGSGTISATLFGYAARNLSDVLTLAVEPQ